VTPKERADYVAMQVIALAMTSSSSIPIRDLIAAEIQSAVDEARAGLRREIIDATLDESKAVQIVRAEALEEAAKWIESHCGVDEFFSDMALKHRKYIAEQIRALIPKDKP
jgi:hypothetical protein